MKRKDVLGERLQGEKISETPWGEGTLLRSCAYGALSAIIIEKASFPVVGIIGYGISASLIGQSNMELVDCSTILERARTIANAISAPLDVDMDTSYGNALKVNWTVNNFMRIGVASVRVEDQVWPKRCGHMAGNNVISSDAKVNKILAAVKARKKEGYDIVLGARTGARGSEGLGSILERAKAYVEAGADYIYVEAPQSLDGIKLLKEGILVPLALNVILEGAMPELTIDELEETGVDFFSIPMIALYPAASAMREAIAILRDERDLTAVSQLGVSRSEFNEIVGLEQWSSLESELGDGIRDI